MSRHNNLAVCAVMAAAMVGGAGCKKLVQKLVGRGDAGAVATTTTMPAPAKKPEVVTMLANGVPCVAPPPGGHELEAKKKKADEARASRGGAGGGSGGGGGCPSGKTMCSTGCEDLQTSRTNCGSCGHLCEGEKFACNHGQCW